MKVDIYEVKEQIRSAVMRYEHLQIDDDDKSLLASEYQIPAADFLYILRDLERSYGDAVYKVFETNDYSVFSVNNFAKAISEVCASMVEESRN
ncbi:MAG: hypothetical protein KHY77_10195 [Butyricicoccus pullicaecorum]|nr:hypothetical protein [Butyricicoccus pullicaecorum]